jgi:hypothetical protein
MTQAQERRAPGQARLPVETLVEVCGNEPGIPAFEAESVDVSSRGMHLRTAYLPDEGAPLVCRFEEQGREIVVEGVVAWRREGARGGEFGIEFTALDSGSVDALRELCDAPRDESGAQGAAAQQALPLHDAGSKVRLHIEGLGAPMKARVRSGDPRKVQVGSSLEFLKVGRHLEIEDLEHGGRRSAQIDAVTVAIDPETKVPQLVVALRYEGAEESTPEPSALDLSNEAPATRAHRIAVENVSLGGDVGAPAEFADHGDREVEALRGKLGMAATQAGEAASSAGKKMAELSSTAASSIGQWLRGASAKMAELSRREKPAPRRTTAPPPGGPIGIEGKRLRPQSGDKPQQAVASPQGKLAALASAASAMPRKHKLMASAAALSLIAGSALALRDPRPSSNAPASAPATALASAAAPQASALAGAPLTSSSGGVVTAAVPLFGPTPMATMEPAPLAPPAPGEPDIEALEKAEAMASLSAPAPDEAFEDEGPSEPAKPAKRAKKPEDVAPWGRGKVQSPTIHRLRLDAPGEALQGSFQPTGFTIVVPSRKVMEQGGAIAKRDPRIARVRTVNTPNGAQITFQFKDGVPAYRTRLRRDYVEFLISAPEPKPAASKVSKSKSGKTNP